MSGDPSKRSRRYSEVYKLNGNPSGEDIEDYRMNGLHPVKIDDLYHNGTYRILHKLGYGGSSTVWIAQKKIDQKLYALKFLSSNASARSYELKKMQQVNTPRALQAFIPRLVDNFEFTGPNCLIGRNHRVLVFELFGPSIFDLSYESSRLHPQIVQTMMHQAAKALVELHKANIVHLDLTPRNVLLKLNPEVCGLSRELLYQNFGKPRASKVRRKDGKDPKPHAPDVSFWSIDLAAVPKYLIPNPVLIDFGESADPRRVKSRLRAIPPMYASPEAIFENRVDPSCDIWSLGCIIFKARAGYDLFPGDMWGPDQVYEVAYQMVFRLGCPPPFEHWRTARFNGRGGVSLSHTYKLRRRQQAETWIEKIECHYYPPLEDMVRKIRDRPAEAKVNDIFWSFGRSNGRCIMYEEDEAKFPFISQEEADLLYDLLSRIFVWDPRKRITGVELVKHPWFRFHK